MRMFVFDYNGSGGEIAINRNVIFIFFSIFRYGVEDGDLSPRFAGKQSLFSNRWKKENKKGEFSRYS